MTRIIQKYIRSAVTLLAATILAVMIAVTFIGAVTADEYGSFDDRGNYNYHGADSMRPSFSDPGYNSYHRSQELQERQERSSQPQEYNYGSTGGNSRTNELDYTPPSVTVFPDGKSLTCYGPTRGNPLTTCYKPAKVSNPALAAYQVCVNTPYRVSDLLLALRVSLSH